MCYWAKSPTDLAITEACLKSGTQKPNVYVEFGSVDGLKEAVLESYDRIAVNLFCDTLEREQFFEIAVEKLIAFTIQDSLKLGLPDGCPLREMRARRDGLGTLTRKKWMDFAALKSTSIKYRLKV